LVPKQKFADFVTEMARHNVQLAEKSIAAAFTRY